MSEQFVGVWENVPGTTEGFDDVMDALKVDPSKREAWRKMKMTIEYALDGDQWTANVNVGGRPTPRVIKFKSGDTIDMEGFEGQKIKATFVIDGGKMMETQYITSENFGSSPKKFVVSREVQGNQINVETTVDGKTMKSKLIKQ